MGCYLVTAVRSPYAGEAPAGHSDACLEFSLSGVCKPPAKGPGCVRTGSAQETRFDLKQHTAFGWVVSLLSGISFWIQEIQDKGQLSWGGNVKFHNNSKSNWVKPHPEMENEKERK